MNKWITAQNLLDLLEEEGRKIDRGEIHASSDYADALNTAQQAILLLLKYW